MAKKRAAKNGEKAAHIHKRYMKSWPKHDAGSKPKPMGDYVFGRPAVDIEDVTFATRFGLMLRSVRLRREMTQKEVGNGLKDLGLIEGKSKVQPKIHMYESGSRMPSLPVLAGLCTILDCSADQLIPKWDAEDVIAWQKSQKIKKSARKKGSDGLVSEHFANGD